MAKRKKKRDGSVPNKKDQWTQDELVSAIKKGLNFQKKQKSKINLSKWEVGESSLALKK